MHVIVATDGSKQSLAAAKHLKSFGDPTKITEISVIAVIRPLAAVAFADDLSTIDRPKAGTEALSFRAAAENAVDMVAAVFEGWGPKVHRRVRSGSPANEIIKAAKQLSPGSSSSPPVAEGSATWCSLGRTAQRVQHYAPVPRARGAARAAGVTPGGEQGGKELSGIA